MRRKQDTQGRLEFRASNLKVTNAHFARYEAISAILDATPKLLAVVHVDLERALELENGERRRRGDFVYTSEMVLRLALCQVIEGASLRELVVRVDDSNYLRRFTRIYDGPMMNFTTLCRLRNAIRPDTWKKLNLILAEAAAEDGRITGEKLRLDTTAVETNTHWPTDSSLLWDGYRTLGRLIERARTVAPEALGNRRLHLRRVKAITTRIARQGKRKGRKASQLKALYKRLIRKVEVICDWTLELIPALERELRSSRYAGVDHAIVALVEELRHFEPLVRHAIWQASERVLHERSVRNDDKLFSIFEPHTELLVRGKAGKEVEFGHMIQIQQVGEKFITDYDVFEKRPAEPALVRPALENHKTIFGHLPAHLAADKGYWSARELAKVFEQVETVSIPKKGGRDRAQLERESSALFRLAQQFRAGIEGSISFLKRILRLARCMNKGWEHYISTVGATIFAHNLLVLARS